MQLKAPLPPRLCSCSPRPLFSAPYCSRPYPLLFGLLCHLSGFLSQNSSYLERLLLLCVCLGETGCWSSWPLSALSESHPAGQSHQSFTSVKCQWRVAVSSKSLPLYLCRPARLPGMTWLGFPLRLCLLISDGGQIESRPGERFKCVKHQFVCCSDAVTPVKKQITNRYAYRYFMVIASKECTFIKVWKPFSRASLTDQDLCKLWK